MMTRPTVTRLLSELATGDTTGQELVENAFGRIDDPAGEGSRTFIRLYKAQAAAAAEAQDIMRDNGRNGPLSGIPISVKDLFDISGEVTTAGSIVLRDAIPATRN